MLKLFRLFLFLYLLPGFSTSVFAVEIKVKLDRNPVNINDSFLLTFSSNESPDDDPDFSPLEQDFEILNQQQNSSTSIINGNFTRQLTWNLYLMPKRSGRLKIPAIRFGDDASQAINLQVTDQPQNINSNEPIFLEVNVQPNKPYVQSQVIYTLKFYRNVQISQASLTEPQLENAVIEKLGEDSTYTTQINGVEYAITERKYAIFPQQSGQMEIAPLTLTAEVVNRQRQRFGGFFNSRGGQTKRVRSQAVTLDVQAIPETYQHAHWLPARQLHLREQWSADKLEVKVGEPLTRTLTLLAQGATAGQLPELGELSQSEDLKNYPDQPVLKEQKKAEGLIAFREEKIAFIPAHPGQYQLPAIEIPWFNIATGQIEFARLPAVNITAVAVAQQAQSESAPPILNADAAPPIKIVEKSAKPYWMWISILLALGWTANIVYLLRKRKNNPLSEQATNPPQQADLKSIQKALKQSCEQNNPQAARQALLEWGKEQYNAYNLAALSPNCSSELKAQIQLLNQSLYAATPQAWDGQMLFQTFLANQTRQDNAEDGNAEVLKPLYPAN